MAKCPECGGTQIEQYMMPYGPMWCMDCGFRVEEKMADPNPFLNDTPDSAAPAQTEGPRPGLGAQMAARAARKRKKK
jgi:transcription initiation factor TFIIIB Brf1 subunit/transcription initiation factor TFIIB